MKNEERTNKDYGLGIVKATEEREKIENKGLKSGIRIMNLELGVEIWN